MATAFTYTYDVAVRSLAYTRFNSILGLSSLGATQAEAINKGVAICPKRIAQRAISEKRGETFLEFINVYPKTMSFDWKRQRTSVARTGIRYLKFGNTVGLIKADAVTLEYDMWFWSNSLDKVRQCAEKYLQWQHDTPKITFYFEDEFEMNPDLRFSPVADESAIEDIFNTGKIWVYRMPILIEGWLPKLGTESKQIHKIQLTTYDQDDIEDYTTIIDGSLDSDLTDALRMLQANLYGITDVDVDAKTFTISQDQTGDFSVGTQFIVENSTDNNGVYTVVSAVYSDSETVLTVSEALGGSTVDGNIYLHEETN